ncbi:MAG TPA: hypothetical protein VLK23_15405 [Thermodesulfobacteriota bacterium]|nr:hypothetical protein [Thermodesulfobacteriota bacterium]
MRELWNNLFVGWSKEFRGKLRLLFDALRKFNADHGFLFSSAITFNFLICGTIKKRKYPPFMSHTIGRP